jgi:hypothetical protein
MLAHESYDFNFLYYFVLLSGLVGAALVRLRIRDGLGYYGHGNGSRNAWRYRACPRQAQRKPRGGHRDCWRHRAVRRPLSSIGLVVPSVGRHSSSGEAAI